MPVGQGYSAGWAGLFCRLDRVILPVGQGYSAGWAGLFCRLGWVILPVGHKLAVLEDHTQQIVLI